MKLPTRQPQVGQVPSLIIGPVHPYWLAVPWSVVEAASVTYDVTYERLSVLPLQR